MNHGLSASDLDILHQLIVKRLSPHGVRLWLFGSRARGDQRAYSDIDILFEKASPLAAGLLTQIKHDLEDSRLPYKVDIVDIEELADSYLEGVLKDRIALENITQAL